MKQAFKYKKLTIEVRAETGRDLLDKPTLNRLVADAIQGEIDTDVTKINPLVWNRYCAYARFLQLTTVKGGSKFQNLDEPFEHLSPLLKSGYDEWCNLIADMTFYRQWQRVIDQVNKETFATDPQAESAEENSESA